MPKGHAPKRESKKPKKKADKTPVIIAPIVPSGEVEVIKKRKKSRQEEL